MRLAAFLLAMLIACSTPAVAQAPIINNIVGQASLAVPVSPGMPVLVNGTNLAGGSSDCPGPVVPFVCGSVSVTMNGQPVPVRFAVPTQLNTYVPADQPTGSVTVVVKNHQGLNSAPFTVTVEQYVPGIQRLSDAATNLLGFFTDSSQRAISRTNPASAGQEVTMYAVGLGPTNPKVAAGQVGVAPTASMPIVWVGNRSVPVLSAGLGCGLICDPGNYLVRFLLPSDTASGDVQVSVEISGKRSPAATLVVGALTSVPAVGYLQSLFDSSSRAMSPGMVANVVGGGFMRQPSGGGPCQVDPSYWLTNCLGLTVTINGSAVPIQFATPNFITIQIPYELSPGAATLTVERTSEGATVKSSPFSFTLDAYSPTLPVNPPSMYAGVIIQNSGGPASVTNPLLPGDTIYVFAAGLGQTIPPMASGFSQLQAARTAVTPTLTIGGKALSGITSEAMAGSIGQYRVTATVPDGLGTGDRPIVLEIGGKKSQAGLLVPVAQDPVIAAVTNAASSTLDIVSGSWVSIYGRNLSAATRTWNESDIIYDWLPTELEKVNVAIDNVPAVVAFVSPTQLNVLAPDNLPSGRVELTVSSPMGWQKTFVNVKPYSPGLFTLPVPPGIYLAALHTDWAYVASSGQLAPNIPARPAAPGETIVFYGTGFGPTDPQAPAYHRFTGAAALSGTPPVRVQIGSIQAQVSFTGLIGNGLYQLNVVVPNVPDGDHEVVVTMGSEASPRGRYIPVRR